ncbi:MAG TPA: alpha/beta fold hydrolase [Ilumatobacteraceae bacterium]|nr:alpha/beta fold hydrolase [Ilumatobacteraceae bacterium]
MNAPTDESAVPVVLVHGWAGSFESTWQRSGFTDLLADARRPVIGIDLLGHGNAPKPHDAASYVDLTDRVFEAMPAEPVDAIGFSMGALTLLRCAVRQPHRFRRLVLGGIGRNAFDTPSADRAEDFANAIQFGADPVDKQASAFASYARAPGNDPVALAMAMRTAEQRRFRPEELTVVTCPTLVAIGDQDFAGPGDVLVDALPNATLTVLRNTDHFATPESFAFIDAALEFIGAVPS